MKVLFAATASPRGVPSLPHVSVIVCRVCVSLLRSARGLQGEHRLSNKLDVCVCVKKLNKSRAGGAERHVIIHLLIAFIIHRVKDDKIV